MEDLDARLRETPADRFHEMVAQISEIDEFKGWWNGRHLADTATLKRLKKQVVLLSAVASVRIGGRHAPPVAGVAAARGTGSREEYDAHVAGYAELLRAVFDEYGQLQFGQDLIRQFHARLLQYSRADRAHRGEYKGVTYTASSYLQHKMEPRALRSADPDRTPRALQSAIEWTSTRLAGSDFQPLLVIAGFILEFLAIRPFVSGNGRMSRILTNFLLLRAGYTFVPYASLEQVIADRWPEYYVALRHSQSNANLSHPNITPWLSVFLETIRIQTRQLRSVVDKRLDVSRLSQNQLRVLQLLERNAEITNRLICSELGIPQDTAKQVLSRLRALDLVQRRGAGRAVRYRKIPGLP
jgi:Fic family protein